ncbi:hypothetical protein B2J93_682 [Marssonina coronariae]|uniref:Major facilitator superfamily (MFS) profile domain-containing protein n=1 Tax=Diplocarpon coronariae TaxID=2795749 RepID=A0A218Z8Z4_9HELO|nr:hypothetical protein B2J93_682 [Marssonina coronariae]
MASRCVSRGLEELGITSLWSSPVDVKLLCCQRFVRLVAYGGSTLILVSRLRELGISEERVGLFMTLTLLGDLAISAVLTLCADALGRKCVLAAGALLMSAAGAMFALCDNYWILLLAAIVGVISPSGNEIGPFRAIEESIIAHLTPVANRGDVYAWYSLIAATGTALGLMTTGWVLTYMVEDLKWEATQAYRAVFSVYAVLGLLKLLLTLALSRAVELEEKVAPDEEVETSPLIRDGAEDQEQKKRNWLLSKLSTISPESRTIVCQLCILFMLDSFSSGLAPLSWVTYFFHQKFNMKEGVLGALFFTTAIVAAVSMLLASSIAKRIGNIQTMVFTHLPSAIFLALIPIPSSLPIAMLFLILRSCTQSMDVAPRTAFLAAVVLPHERTAAMGLINVAKTLGQSFGPLVTGLLAGKGLFWVAFVTAGSLKAMYDLGMLAVFSGHETRDDRAEEERLSESEAPDQG